MLLYQLSGFVVKGFFWSNGFNAVRDLKQRVDINDHWPSYPLMKIKFSNGKI